jgi:RHS repeat-associated protein
MSRPSNYRCTIIFRKTGGGQKRAYLPQTLLLRSKSPTTNLGPFGEVIRATSSITPFIPMRWSTKYSHVETDLVYYGYRYYNPSTGRWLSRDPIGEKGGLNLYSFTKNVPPQNIDPLGLRLVASGDNPGTVDTIECDGKGGIRVFLTQATLNGCSAWRSCRTAHERSHADDALAESKNICGCSQQASVKAGTQVAYRGVLFGAFNASERKAYDTEIAWIRDKAAAGVWDCDGSAEDAIKLLQQARKRYE